MNKHQKDMAERKRQRKLEQAKKKKKQNKIVLLIIAVAIVAVIAAAIGFFAYQASKDRVYTAEDGLTSVTLHDNGKFTVRFAHVGEGRGTYAEVAEDGAITVSFTINNMTADGRIEGDVLIIPEEWDDGHGHSTRLVLKGGVDHAPEGGHDEHDD